MFSLYKESESGSDQEEEQKKPSVPHNKSHRLEDASDEDSAAFLNVLEGTKQVDFYKNPTILSRLLLSNKYSNAIKRVKTHPEEASVWVAMRRNPFKREKLLRAYLRKDRSDRSFQGSVRSISTSQKNFYNVSKAQREIMLDYSMRQLPIHMACSSLIRPTKPEEQTQLEKLIALLVVKYPEGCEQYDHDGKLPLHEAIWHNASSETISMMLMAYPRSLHERDKFGRSPLDLNRIRSGGDKEKVKDLLVKGVTFWEEARAHAFAGMKGREDSDSVEGIDEISVLTPASQPSLRPDPRGNLNPVVRDISRQIKYNTGQIADDGSLASREQDDDFSVVEPISWVKLEQRAVYLEQLLAGMYEKNYELGETVEELTRERLNLQEELEKMSKYGTNCTDESLMEENERLRVEVAALERALSDANGKDVRTSMAIREGSTGSLDEYTAEQRDVDQIEYLREQNLELQDEVNALSERTQQYESQVNRLEVIIAAMNKPSDNEDNVSVDSPLASIPEDGSPARPSGTKEIQNNRSETAQDDLDSLLESLSVNSRYATERFLAGKIQLLESRLDEEMAAREADVRANNHENKRLLMENAALQSEIGRLSTRNLGASQRGNASRNSFGMVNSSRSMYDEDSIGEESQFEVLLNEAFQLYGTKQSSESLISASTSKLGDVDSENPMNQIRDEVERIESEYGKPVPLEVKMSLVSAVSSLSLNTKAPENDAEDLDAFLEEASKFYGKPIPSDLRSAMQGTSLVSLSSHHVIVPTQQPDVDDDLGKMFEEAGRLYQKPIPAEVRAAVREVVSTGSSRKPSDDTLPTSNLSPATSSTYDTEQELQNIINEAERAYGKPLPPDMKYALFTASVSSGVSFHSLDESPNTLTSSGSPPRSEDETDEIEQLFNEAEKLYQKPIPAGVKSVVRNAVSASVGLDGSSSERPLLTPETTGTFSSDPEAELHDIIQDAERAYGRSLPADLKVALLTASVSSGLSLRSLGESSRYVGNEEPEKLLGNDDGESLEEDDLEIMFQEAAILYKQPIPSGVKSVVRDAVTSSSSIVQSDPEAAADVEEELEAIIRDAENAYGGSLPEDLKHALLTASVSSGLSFRSLESAPPPLDTDHGTRVASAKAVSSEVSTTSDDLNEMFREAAKQYGSTGKFDAPSTQASLRDVKPAGASTSNVPSHGTTFASDNLEDIFSSAAKGLEQGDASKSSMSVGSESASTEVNTYLPRALSTAAQKKQTKPSIASETSQLSDPQDDLESILREAERSYGMELPEDLKHAVRSASLKSGLSFRTNDLLESSRVACKSPEELDVEDDDLERMFEQAQYRVFQKQGAPVNVGEDDDLEKMFEEAARLYDKPIPPQLMNAMRDAVSPDDGRGESSSESEAQDRTDESSESSFDEGELHSIIREAERKKGGEISTELKSALLDGESFRSSDLKEAAASQSEMFFQTAKSYSRSVLSETESKQDSSKVESGGEPAVGPPAGDDLNEMYAQAARAHSRRGKYDKSPSDVARRQSSSKSIGSGSWLSGTSENDDVSAMLKRQYNDRLNQEDSK